MSARGLVTSLVLALSACGASGPTSPTPNVPLGEAFTLRVGDLAHVDSALAVRVDGIPADSRCPIDVNCITGGDATVQVVIGPVVGDGPERLYELHTGPDNARREVDIVGGRRLVLLSLEPLPKSGVALRQSDYRTTLRIERAE